jgi:hypothetical protein
MSIDDEIGNRVAERRLFPMRPKAPGAAERRVMFVSEWLNRPLASDTVADVERIARLEAQLSHFVEGGIVDWNYMRPLKSPPMPCSRYDPAGHDRASACLASLHRKTYS